VVSFLLLLLLLLLLFLLLLLVLLVLLLYLLDLGKGGLIRSHHPHRPHLEIDLFCLSECLNEGGEILSRSPVCLVVLFVKWISIVTFLVCAPILVIFLVCVACVFFFCSSDLVPSYGIREI